MKKRRTAAVLATALAAALMLTACKAKESATTAASSEKTTSTEAKTAESTTQGKTQATAKETTKTEAAAARDSIIVANSVDLKSMDPQNQSDVASGLIIRHLYNRLLEIHDDGTLVCDLAESYEMLDETTYHFKLKEGVKFHDGTEMKASDVKFTLERAKTMASTTSSASHIESVACDGDYEVTVKLTDPYPAMLYILGNMGMSILSEKAVTEGGEDYAMHPIGTGPFKFAEWVPNDYWVVERNEDYFGEKPLASKITCRVVPEAGSRCISLETGEADVSLRISETDAPNIEKNPDLKIYAETGTAIEFMGMNMENEYLKNQKVRQAIQYAVDKQAIVDTIIEGRGEIANSYIGKTIPGWDETLEPYPYDPEKAKELIAEAGYADGFKLVMNVNGDVRSRTAQIIQAQLAEIGITVDVNTYDFGAFLDMLKTGDQDLFLLGWTNSSIDPDRSVAPLFLSNQCGANGNNYTFLRDETLDKEIGAAAIETDHEKRMEMYKGIQGHLKELSPWVPLYYQEMIVGAKADLKGFTYDKNMSYYFGDCHYEGK